MSLHNRNLSSSAEEILQMEKKKEEKNIFIVFLGSFIITNLIGYLMNIDILKTSIVRENTRTIHFVSLYISLLVTIIYYMIYRIISKYKRK